MRDRQPGPLTTRAVSLRRVFVLNFYSPVFIDQLKRGRKTATIRLGDKAAKYRKGEVVLVTVGFQHAPRERTAARLFRRRGVLGQDFLSGHQNDCPRPT